MSDDLDRCRVNSLVELPGSSPVEGWVRWDPVHSLWNGTMLAGTLAAPFLFSWRALAVCLLLAGATLLLARGPFTVDDELALLREHAVDVVVTKDSGGHMTEAKLTAARMLGIPVVLVRRPALPAGVAVVDTVEAALAWLR